MGRKILVVDNNPVIIRLFENFLKKQGHEVKTAENGLRALEIVQDYVPDAIFVDLVMPKINGRQFCRAIRNESTFDETVITIITATAAEDNEIGFHNFGADYCIAKAPFQEMAQYILEVLDLPRIRAPHSPTEFVYGVNKLYKREVTKELLICNKHLELVLKYITDGVLEFTSDRKIIFSNQAVENFTEKSEASILSTDILNLFEEKDRILIQKKIHEANRKKQPASLDTPVRLGNRMVTLHFIPISEDRQKCCIALAHDMSSDLARSAAEKRLEKQARIAHTARLIALGELASGVAHEMRQPISVIDLACQYMQSLLGKENSEPLNVLKKIKAQSQRLAFLTENMRSFARPDNEGNHQLEFIAAINLALSFFKEQFRLHEITIRQDLSTSLPLLRIDPHKFEQVIINLLANARYAVDARAETETGKYKKEIIIRLYQSNNDIILEVGDNGTGMSEEVRRCCLESFYTTKDETEGTGIGLSIVETLITEFGGRLEIESLIGTGSTFRIFIPKKHMVAPQEVMKFQLHTGE